MRRVLTDEFGVQVLDRSGLILDIFAQRAKTKEGRLQVELAQYQYLLPRLTGMWTHLTRQNALNCSSIAGQHSSVSRTGGGGGVLSRGTALTVRRGAAGSAGCAGAGIS